MIDDNTDKEDLCKFCEEHIIEGSSMTSHFLCEGRYCEEAAERYKEFISEDEPEELGLCTICNNIVPEQYICNEKQMPLIPGD